MVLAQFLDTYYPAVDGVVTVVDNYARELTRRHCECDVVVPSFPEGPMENRGYRTVYCRSLPTPGSDPFRLAVPMLDPPVFAELMSRQYSLLHAHSPFTMGQLALQLGRLHRIPVVTTFHSKFYDDVKARTHSEKLAKMATNLVVHFYNQCDEVWAVSEGSAGTLRQYGYEGPIRVMPNGMDRHVFRKTVDVDEMLSLPKGVPILLYVGQLVWQKNLRVILEAAAELQRQGRDFLLLMVGDGRARDGVKGLMREWGLEGRVRLAGRILDRDALFAIYQRAELFLFPSLYDNMPMVVLEAATMGCPALLAAGSNAAERVRDGVNGFLCEPTGEAVAARVAQILSDPEGRQRAGRNAAETLPIGWGGIVDEAWAQYRLLMAQKRRMG